MLPAVSSRFERTDRYTYILELDDRNVIGGNWYGASTQKHLTFVESTQSELLFCPPLRPLMFVN